MVNKMELAEMTKLAVWVIENILSKFNADWQTP